MNILIFLRRENSSLVNELHEAGHTMWAEWDSAREFRELLRVPIEPFDDGEKDLDLPEPFKFGNNISRTIDAVSNCIEKNNIDALITWTDAPPRERAAVLTARKYGVPTFEITHGSTNTYRQGHFEFESYVDYILAPGQHEADFRKFYGSKANVVVTGKPSFDWITQVENLALSRDQARLRFKISERRPVILHAMTWRHPFSTWERDKDYGDLAVIEAHMNLLPICNTFLLVKPHYCMGTKEYADQLRNWLDEMGVVDCGVMVGGPVVPLTMADVVVTHKSSIMIEALMMDIPVVMFEFRERNDFSWFKGYGAELVTNRGDLYPAIARCLLDKPTKDRLAEERKRGLEYFNYKCDGKAGERCVKFIEKIVAERSNGRAAV